jgi:predicted Zn finger-like uncharacterized protein
MIIKCSHCSGSMRVDESRVPKGQKVKIRCPHCKEIGVFQDQPAVDPNPGPQGLADASGAREESPPRRRATGNGVSEHTLPSDAFQSFRFPSEREATLDERPAAGRRFGLVTWILISLGVVAFFALLVNLILSGPAR